MGTYVISDIHGCFDDFQKMLEIIDFSGEDELILAGDYLDRGPKSTQMLRWLMDRPSFSAILPPFLIKRPGITPEEAFFITGMKRKTAISIT